MWSNFQTDFNEFMAANIEWIQTIFPYTLYAMIIIAGVLLTRGVTCK